MTNKIYEELKRRIEAAGFEAITITMNCNNDEITITPCWMGCGAPHNFDEVEFYLMDSQVMNLCGNERLEKIADTVARYEELLEEDARALEALKAHIRAHGEKSDWDFVSDYHKDIFGHRPHVPTAQIIAWAHSGSKNSARFYA